MKELKQKIGILGYGEVGKAIAKFYKKPLIKDLKRDDNLENLDILNICIPYSNNFIKIVKKQIKFSKPKLTIIHSTVAPGTTKKIGSNIVHSPVRGVHPNLYPGIKIFVKYIGADNKKTGLLAQRHLRSLGIKTKLFMPSATTELGKLLSTTYYGLCIAWHGEMQKFCKKLKIDFDQAVTDFNTTYNQGYKKLKMPQVMRPALYPPKNNKIGGHCVIPNAKILQKFFKSSSLGAVLEYN